MVATHAASNLGVATARPQALARAAGLEIEYRHCMFFVEVAL